MKNSKVISKVILCLSIILFFSLNVFSQESLWKVSNKKFIIGERSGVVEKYVSYELNLPAMILALNGVINEDLPGAFASGPIISLPMADGTFSSFRVASAALMPKNLADQFPSIRTFSAIGIDNPAAIAKLDYTEWGFHAMIMAPGSWVFIDPANQGNTSQYICYNRKDSRPSTSFYCEAMNSFYDQRITTPTPEILLRTSGDSLKTYRLAVACTGEYAAFHGGTVSGALAAINTSVNRVNGVYENEVAVRLVLIANNNLIVYTNSATDPYTNGNGSTMLGQNQTTLTNIIGSANYDIGHVFSTGGGGVAYLNSVCNSSNKAGGVTGNGAPVGDNFDIDYVAHEMGHQFGGNHTFNSVTGSCSGNRSSGAAYEPGSGTTIMAYAGICGVDDIQPHSDAIFHTKSFDEIKINITTGTGRTCPVKTLTGNTAPAIAVSANYTIPLNTPFVLTGSATDVNGDPLTYLWEQYDLGPSGAPNSPSGNAPIFRVWTPTTVNYRVFPRMEDLVKNQQTMGEILPTYARSLNFRLTVRDNRAGGGGVNHNDTPVILTVSNTVTPFKVTIPNTAVSWPALTSQTVTWDVSSTDISPISCANVKIMLSVDSGYTYPYTLLASTPNDGTETITLPNVVSTKARIKVESIGNIFFDISNVNFSITAPAVLTTITTSALASNTLCAGGNVNVNFTIDAPANAGNIFTAQLSNDTGGFVSPVSIGTITSATAATIAAVIPAATVGGIGYRIRVVSSNPIVIGSNNGTNIIISKLPLTPGAITGTASVCQGQSGVAYAVPLITNATGYVWTLPSGASIATGANTNSITVNFSGVSASGSITVRGTNTACGNGPVSASFTVTVNSNVTPVVSIASSVGSTICSGTSVTFTATPVNGGTTPIYQWKRGATNVGTNSNQYTTTTLTNGNIITCVMTSNAPCVSGSPATSNAITMTVNSNIAASVSIVASTVNTICTGTSVTFTATPINGGTTPTYQWKKGATNVGTNSNQYTTTTLANGDIITCVMTSNATCATPNPATSNAITMTVNGAPTISSFTPTSGGPGTMVTINGNGFFGATSVKFNGINATYMVISNSQITVAVPGSLASGIISIVTPCGTGNSAGSFTVNSSLVTLNLKLFLEGYYQNGEAAGGMMNNNSGTGGLMKVLGISPNVNDVDTVYVSAMNAITHTQVDRKAGVLHLNGSVSVTFSNAVNSSTSYYIRVTHRNALETWSSVPVLLYNIYDFTTAQSKAYGNNMIQTYDNIGWAFYSGDISSAVTATQGIQDGIIESQDYGDIENALAISLNGYVYSDITGDGLTESLDYSLIENNLFYGLITIHP